MRLGIPMVFSFFAPFSDRIALFTGYHARYRGSALPAALTPDEEAAAARFLEEIRSRSARFTPVRTPRLTVNLQHVKGLFSAEGRVRLS